MKLRDKDRLKIDAVCLAATSELFASMINEKNRGPNFTWGKFPDLASRLGTSSVLISNDWNNNKIEEVKKYASEYCEQLARTYLQAAGFQ